MANSALRASITPHIATISQNFQTSYFQHVTHWDYLPTTPRYPQTLRQWKVKHQLSLPHPTAFACRICPRQWAPTGSPTVPPPPLPPQLKTKPPRSSPTPPNTGVFPSNPTVWGPTLASKMSPGLDPLQRLQLPCLAVKPLAPVRLLCKERLGALAVLVLTWADPWAQIWADFTPRLYINGYNRRKHNRHNRLIRHKNIHLPVMMNPWIVNPVLIVPKGDQDRIMLHFNLVPEQFVWRVFVRPLKMYIQKFVPFFAAHLKTFQM